MPNRIAIFIDNAYLQKVLWNEFPGARLDYGALAQKVAGDAEILRSYVYDCHPYQGNPPTDDESERYSRKRRFFRALERIPRLTIRLGELARRGPDSLGIYTFEQKRVDIMLGVDLAMLAAKHLIQEAAIVAGDSDLSYKTTACMREVNHCDRSPAPSINRDLISGVATPGPNGPRPW